jgi:excinuclease UvrABC nuclease subunit
MSVQLRLFPLMKPLLERFGQEFFRGAPREPGVYIMRGARAQILYIGQSKNLRVRLAYYKNANPDRTPRRLIRLVHQVETISWECLPSPEAARARELELLQLHRPRFNRADTAPPFFHFAQWSNDRGQIKIQILPEEPPATKAHLRGPIRGKIIPHQALASLHRLHLACENQLTRCVELPFAPKRLSEIRLGTTSSCESSVNSFLRGDSPELVTKLLEQINPACELPLRQLLEAEAEILLTWFRALAEADKDLTA